MMNFKIPIVNRNREFGLFTWPFDLDVEIRKLFNEQEYINIRVHNKEKRKKVSYKYRRFTLGKKVLSNYSDKSYFILGKNNEGLFIDFQ